MYSEYQDSQKPTIELLQEMGYTFIDEEQGKELRDNVLSNVLLEDILAEQLAKINRFEYKGEHYAFSHSNIQAATNALRSVPDTGLVRTNEKVYDLLTLGKSFVETIAGDQKSYTIQYIDWENPDNNAFHATIEYTIEGLNGKRRTDVVLFVNGIPFVVIENKRRDKANSLKESISQIIRNQKEDEGIPRLFHYAQLLMAVQPNEVKYATTATPAKFWSVWKEDNEEQVKQLVSHRAITAQDRALVSLCEPNRLLELVYKFLVFDGPDKKLARYQQYFAIQETLKTVVQKNADGSRQGGIVWHTQGSGKSLTMVMLSKALALESKIKDPRVVIVTDRISLDKQIYKTFQNCGKNVHKAKSGTHLAELLKDKGNEIITSIIDKFETAVSRSEFTDESENLFVLVDESHRSQFGSSHAKMKKMLPNACYIGFTGTPLMSGEKKTARKFGGIIHSYTIDKAVNDGAVLPLLYEGRLAKLSVNKKQIDKGFDRLSADLNDEATKDLKKKFARISKLYESQQVVEEVAYDIANHYTKSWRGSGFKAQLVVPKIDTAIRYQKYFEEEVNDQLKVNSRVIFTPPDSRDGHYDVQEDPREEGRKYWKKITEKYGSQEAYEEQVIAKFKEKDREVELIIVVAKLLTGFDAPRNTVLYLAKPIHSHNLLQAIARVNRLYEGKEHGYVIDYVGLLGKLDEALTTYSALEGYDDDDLEGAVFDVREELQKLPARLAAIWDVFKGVKNTDDIEAMERHLGPKDVRDNFYKRLTEYGTTLHTALASDEFYTEFTDKEINHYKKEFRDFVKMKRSVQLRYAEVVDYGEYEAKVRKLLDTHIKVDNVYSVTGEVDVLDKSGVQEELAKYGQSTASKADMIASKMKKVFTEKMEQDEAFYKKFSELLEQTILDFRNERIDEKKYLERVLSIQEDFSNGYQEGVPDNVRNAVKGRAFFGAIQSGLSDKLKTTPEILEKLGQAGLEIAQLVEKLTIRDWKKNIDIQRQMENEIEDYLMSKRKDLGIELTFDDIDSILVKALKVAKNNY